MTDPAARIRARPAFTERDIVALHAPAGPLLAHENRHGADQVAAAAARLWRSAEHRLLRTDWVPDPYVRGCTSAVAELAEIAGWLLFDAEQPQAARTATLAAHTLARSAGDSPLQWFALTNLAMMDVEYGRPAEALRIADELLSRLRLPPRVALLARMRRARALAMTGERCRALTEMAVARGELERSLTSRDPAWTWWLDECELAGHEAHMLLSLGRAEQAVPLFRRAVSASQAAEAGGRLALYHRVSLLKSLIACGAWRECEPLLAELPALLREVSSGRGRRALRVALRDLVRAPGAPASLTDLAYDVSGFAQPPVQGAGTKTTCSGNRFRPEDHAAEQHGEWSQPLRSTARAQRDFSSFPHRDTAWLPRRILTVGASTRSAIRKISGCREEE